MSASFDEQAKKYRCCCKACHSVTGTVIIGIIFLVSVAIELSKAALYTLSVLTASSETVDQPTAADRKVLIHKGEHKDIEAAGEQGQSPWLWHWTPPVLSVLCQFVLLLVLICLFVGLCKKKASLLIPFIVVQVVYLLLTAIFAVAFLLAAVYVLTTHKTLGELGNKSVGAADFRVLAVIAPAALLLLLFVVLEVLQLWWLLVVLACYRYFKDREANLSFPQMVYSIVAEKM